MGWTVEHPVRRRVSLHFQTGPETHPSLLYIGYRVSFAEPKKAGLWPRIPTSSADFDVASVSPECLLGLGTT